jgi:hypothetical protein
MEGVPDMQIDDKQLLESIDRRLSVLTNLMAYQLAQGKTIAEGAPLLRRLGLRQSEIAELFDSTSKAISVRLAEAKKKPRHRNAR